jgi:GTPase SAR1 family protein
MFGQVVVGAPGAGKTTYCNGMQQFMEALKRRVAVVNLDPANDLLPYKCALNITDLVRVDVVMEKEELGPNGALMYCMEYLEVNLDWLKQRVLTLQAEGFYVLLDCPGQVELYTHHPSMGRVLAAMSRWNCRLTVVHLVDCLHCQQPASYIAALLLSLTTMLQLHMPHINVLSKWDNLHEKELALGVDFYLEVQDLRHLRRHLDRHLPRAFRRLNKALAELVEDFGLVSFIPLSIADKESVASLLQAIDRSNGYVFGGLSRANDSILQVAAGPLPRTY